MPYDCLGGWCTEDPDGPYETLTECTMDGCSAPTFNCSWTGCVQVNAFTGTWPTIELCEANCVPGEPPHTYNCLGGFCIDPRDGTGVYSTLSECTTDGCTAPTYDCSLGRCVENLNGNGDFDTFELCEADCTPTTEPTYNCIGGICTDPLDGSGEFATYGECIESGCSGAVAIPAACALDTQTHIIKRRVGCSSMFPLYQDPTRYDIGRNSGDDGCSAMLAPYELEPDKYIITRLLQPGNPPCLCVPNPESCDPSGVVMHASIASNCPALNGQEFDLTYIGTDCEHVWEGEFQHGPGPCVLTVRITCSCRGLKVSLDYGENVICPPTATFPQDLNCEPFVIEVCSIGCTHRDFFNNVCCENADICVTITL